MKTVKIANDVFINEVHSINNGGGELALIPEDGNFHFNINIQENLSPAEKYLVFKHEMEHLSQAVNHINKKVFNEKNAVKFSHLMVKAMIKYSPLIIGAAELSTLPSPRRFIKILSEKQKEELFAIIKLMDVALDKK